MPDIFDPRKRSEIMGKIRSTGTAPEVRLQRMVRAILGHRWRIEHNVGDLPGKPDVIIPTLSLIVFLDSCFFHQCPQHGRIPDTNQSYWKPKLAKNVKRDRANRRKLRSMGFSVWRFWSHDLNGRRIEVTYSKLERRLLLHVKKWVRSGRPRPSSATSGRV